MPELRLYYPHGVITGPHAPETWAHGPDDGLQVVVLMDPYPDGRRPWRGVDDRQLWTGEDVFDPFGWGPKRGSLLPDAEYFAIWERAAYDTQVG